MPSELDDLVLSQVPANKPQGLTFDDVPVRNDIGPLTAFVRGTRRGGSSGWDDELAGLAAASYLAHQGGHDFGYYYDPKAFIRDVLAGGARVTAENFAPALFGQEGSRAYDKAVAVERGRVKAAEEQYPRTTLAGEIVGGLTTPFGGSLRTGAKLSERMLQGTKIGALLGAIGGAGRGEDLAGRAWGATIGVPLGGAVGGALGAAAPALAKGAEWLRSAGARAAQPLVRAVRDPLHTSKPQQRDSAPSQSLTAGFYPPPRMQRDFAADYPNGAPINDKGQLLLDVDSYPLEGTKRIVGRQTLGGSDKALRRDAIGPLAKDLTGELPYKVPASRMKGAVGFTQQRNGLPEGIWYAEELSPNDAAAVIVHELGHALHMHTRKKLSELTETSTVQKELRRVYDHLNNPNPDRGRYPKPEIEQFKPIDFGYLPHQWPDEYLAEAARAYMMYPGWFKTVAPETAKALRQVVREHQEIRKYIRLNSLAPTTVGGAAAAGAGLLGGSQEEAATGG
jgi:hypothetical protein